MQEQPDAGHVLPRRRGHREGPNVTPQSPTTGGDSWTAYLQPSVVLTVGILALLGGICLGFFRRRAGDRRLLEQ
ncbi:hypothetical protein SAMN05660748_4507 [Blastococcus aggregatus]|uniref:Uncharacterized protein n=1 Tax=Blastococcus aggregatus TaxID=38502 RepID=A0A285VHN8_9ACTN|nr:hypothetical protein SAMN05660748_4507 [Blastococcus aggregatus]